VDRVCKVKVSFPPKTGQQVMNKTRGKRCGGTSASCGSCISYEDVVGWIFRQQSGLGRKDDTGVCEIPGKVGLGQA